MASGSAWAGVDLDHFPCAKRVPSNARKIIRTLDSYTEFSPSGEGVHILIKAEMPEGA